LSAAPGFCYSFVPDVKAKTNAEEWFSNGKRLQAVECLASAMNIFEGRVRWLLILWILTISAVSFLDRVNISIAGPSIEREFHLDHIQLGWVFSAWVVGYALFQAPSGRLADRFGPRRILFLGTLWWAVFTALTALVPQR